MLLLEWINIIISWVLLLLMILLSMPALTRYYVRKFKIKNDHWLSIVNKFLHKQHIRLSVICFICMIFHIILSFIALKHLPLLGYIIILLFVLLALSGHLKKKFSLKWFAMHRRTTILILIAVILHILYELP